MLALLSCSASGLLVSPAMHPAVQPVRASVSMAAVDEFTISKDIKCVRIYDGDYVRAQTAHAHHCCAPCPAPLRSSTAGNAVFSPPA
jgi:hypothetical protein